MSVLLLEPPPKDDDMKHSRARFSLAMLLTGGCITPADADPVLEFDRARAADLPEAGSALAYGMLRVVNELGFDALDVDVALNRRSARSIVTARAGSDETLETADDHYIADVAQLDALYWLGPTNLARIESYAIDEGYVPDALPEPTCDPALRASIEQCLRFIEGAAEPSPSPGSLGWGPYAADLRGSCLEASDPSYPSAAFFAATGGIGWLDPTLGHHARGCEDGDALACALGVAGVAARQMPQCDALYDAQPPVLESYPADPADAADWDAAIADLNAASPDGGYTLRIYGYAPGMTPTLLGDVMAQVLVTAPLEYSGPWLQREADDTMPAVSATAVALLTDVLDDLGLDGAPYDVGTAYEEVPCPNCHTFYESFVLMVRDAGVVVVLDRETFWDS